MSLPIITLNYQAKAMPGIAQFKIATALRTALANIIRKMIAFLRKIVPEAIFRFPAYPPSYAARSEFLLETSLQILRSSRSTDSSLNVIYGFSASYAKHVNDMSGVRWSKPGSQGRFYEAGRAYLNSIFNVEIRKSLAKLKAKPKRETKPKEKAKPEPRKEKKKAKEEKKKKKAPEKKKDIKFFDPHSESNTVRNEIEKIFDSRTGRLLSIDDLAAKTRALGISDAELLKVLELLVDEEIIDHSGGGGKLKLFGKGEGEFFSGNILLRERRRKR